ncbi:MAG: DUF4363 family protein [Clostridia bacterium]|nr:DUF4363 family protein [Clostridia bacterium]
MKGTILTCFIFAALILGMIFAQMSLEKAGDEMTKPLDALTSAVDSDDWETADSVLKDLSEKWAENDKWLAMLIDHGETDLIITTMSEISQYEKYRDKPELMANIETLRELLAHIPKKERVTLENIF